jgi:phenylacetate-CoA ligase
LTGILQAVLNQRDRLAALHALRRHQWLPRGELAARQLTKLKALVRYADARIPYYHRRFKAVGFTPDDLHTVEDLRRIPVTSRLSVNRHHRDFLPDTVEERSIGHWWEGKPYTRSYTSGSSGQPLEVIYDRRGRSYSSALLQYAFAECGVRLRDTFVILMGRTASATDPQYFRHVSTFREWVNTASLNFRRIFLSQSNPMVETVAAMRAIDPDVLYLVVGRLTDLCAHDTAGIAPRLIFTHASTLTEHARALARQRFGVEVFNTYGSEEFPRLGFECPAHAGLHVITDGAVVECLDDAGDPVASGEAGETVVTGLYNRAMPLIRYELGDLAVPLDDACPCGRGWPLLREIQGRKNDRFILPSGRRFRLPVEVIAAFKQHPWCFAQYQLIQETGTRIVCRLVKGTQFDPRVYDHIVTMVTAAIASEDVTVDFEIVDHISRNRSGKRRHMISHVNR